MPVEATPRGGQLSWKSLHVSRAEKDGQSGDPALCYVPVTDAKHSFGYQTRRLDGRLRGRNFSVAWYVIASPEPSTQTTHRMKT